MRKKVIFLDQWINRQSCGVLKKPVNYNHGRKKKENITNCQTNGVDPLETNRSFVSTNS